MLTGQHHGRSFRDLTSPPVKAQSARLPLGMVQVKPAWIGVMSSFRSFPVGAPRIGMSAEQRGIEGFTGKGEPSHAAVTLCFIGTRGIGTAAVANASGRATQFTYTLTSALTYGDE